MKNITKIILNFKQKMRFQIFELAKFAENKSICQL